jgi:hypothetical protein
MTDRKDRIMTTRPMTTRRAAIVAPVRTPVGTFGGSLRTVPVEELAAAAIKAVLERTGIDPELVDDVSFAQSYVNGETPCIGRWAALHAGLPVSVPGFRWGYTFAPVDAGTKVTESWEILPDGIARFRDRFGDDAEAQMANRAEAARRGIPVTLAALKKAAEAG